MRKLHPDIYWVLLSRAVEVKKCKTTRSLSLVEVNKLSIYVYGRERRQDQKRELFRDECSFPSLSYVSNQVVKLWILSNVPVTLMSCFIHFSSETISGPCSIPRIWSGWAWFDIVFKAHIFKWTQGTPDKKMQ